MLQRVKEVQESDLRMVGALARNIQRVIAVTQADIDAAAAQGKGWLVKRVVKVNDPLDNLRGGTQLVIKQNSIQPGQNVMRVLYSGNSKTVGPAVAPLSLPGAAADDILSLIAFGGTEQDLPDGYQQLVSLTTDNASYFDADYIINSFDVDVTTDAAMTLLASGPNMLWGFMGSSGNLPRWGVGSYSGNWLYGANATQSSSVATLDTNRHTTVGKMYYSGATPVYSMTVDGVAASALAVSNTEIMEENTLSTFVGARNNRGTAGNFNPSTFYSFKIEKAGELVVNMVPAKRLSDNVVGFYDTVRDRFFTNAGTGTITAGDAAVPTPDYPINIVSNNGVLKARHQSGLPLSYTLLEYAESTGTQYIDLGYKGNGNTKVEVKFKYHTATSASGSGRVFGSRNAAAVDAFAIGSASGTASTNSTVAFFFGNQSYLVTDKSLVLDEWLDVIFDKTTHNINGTDYGDPYNDETFETPQNLKLFGFDNNGTMGYGQVDIAYCKLWDNGVLVRDLVPAKNSSNVVGMYDLVSGQFFTNQGTGDFVAGTAVSDPVEVYAAGPIETIAIKDNNSSIVSTATTEMLLSVDTYTDQQEVISGSVARKCGAVILDSSLEWTYDSTYGRVNATIPNLWGSTVARTVPGFCTHFEWLSHQESISSITAGQCYSAGANRIFLHISQTSAAAFAAWLDAQKNAGTPVIIVFPLENATTETVTAQPMQTAAGDNTAEITQAGMAGLELEVEYVEA